MRTRVDIHGQYGGGSGTRRHPTPRRPAIQVPVVLIRMAGRMRGGCSLGAHAERTSRLQIPRGEGSKGVRTAPVRAVARLFSYLPIWTASVGRDITGADLDSAGVQACYLVGKRSPVCRGKGCNVRDLAVRAIFPIPARCMSSVNATGKGRWPHRQKQARQGS
jgi:hypothetical protein